MVRGIYLATLVIAHLFTLYNGAPARAQERAIEFPVVDDTLRLRNAPGAHSPVVAEIPPDARDIKGTGRTKRVGADVWAEIS